MAEVVLSYEDICQQYLCNIVLYKNKPVFVNSVNADSSVKITDIESQKEIRVQFNLKDFKAPKDRLGMMNIDNTVVYITRIPVRRMEIGLNNRNISMQLLTCSRPMDIYHTTDKIKSYKCKEWVDLMTGNYPSFSKALSQAIATEGTFAFDRQFAVDKMGSIFYKTLNVGKIDLKKKSIKDIVFNDKFKHLIILLEGNHEKTVGIACNC